MATLPGCNEAVPDPDIPAAPSGNGSAAAGPRSNRRSDSTRNAPQVVVFEGVLVRNSDGSEGILTDQGYHYTLRRTPGCMDVTSETPKSDPRAADVIYSDCLEDAMARLLVAQATRDKPNADDNTLRRWLRAPGGQMAAEFRAWPDRDLDTMIRICRAVGRAKFISGDFPKPPRRQLTRRPRPEPRYRFRGVHRGRVFEAHSIERV